MSTRLSDRATWSLSQLGVPAAALTVIVGLLAAPVTILGSCALHEIGHGVVGTALGYEVDRIVLCPGDARVLWRSSPLRPIDSTIMPLAGGIVAAALLSSLYAWAALARLPYRSPWLWAAGFSVAGVAATQAVIGILEGLMPSRYSAAIDERPELFLPLIGGAAIFAITGHLIGWRTVLR